MKLSDLLSPRALAYDQRYHLRFRLLTRATPYTKRLVRLRRRTLARRQRVVGITGTQGKTTTTRAIRAVLGLPESPSVEASPNTQRTIAALILSQSPFRRFAAVEMGLSSINEMRGLMRLVAPEVAVITSVGTEHHRNFPSLAALRDEKALAVRLLPPGGTAILNADDPQVASMAAETTARVLTFGRSPLATVHATDVQLDWPRGTTFTATIAGQSFPIRTRLFGEAGLYAALAALTAAHALDISLGVAATRLARLRPTHRRNELFHLANGAYAYVDDAKAPPESVAFFLDFVRTVPISGRRVFLLGKLDPSPEGDAPFYRDFAAGLRPLASEVVVVGDEEVHAVYRQAFAGAAVDPANAHYVAAAADAIPLLRSLVQPDDVLFIKGTGDRKLTRAAIALAGRRVTCRLAICPYNAQYCQSCPLLAARGATAL